jgi:S1-C subfamily serine protease
VYVWIRSWLCLGSKPSLISIDIDTHAYLGLFLGTLTSDLAQDAGIPVTLKGVYVDRITQIGPADKAGTEVPWKLR